MAWKNGLQKVGAVWHYQIKVASVVYHGSTGFQSRRDAEDFVLEFKRQKRREAGGLEVDSSLTVEGLWKLWLEYAARNHSQAHVRACSVYWDRYVLPDLGKLKVQDLRDGHLEKLRDEYRETHSDRGTNFLVKVLRLVLHWGVDRRLIREAPRVKLVPAADKPIVTVTPELLPGFLAGVDEGNWHYSVAVRAMLFLGLREGEALGMTWEKFGPGLKSYRPGDDSSSTKTLESLELPVPEALREWLVAVPRDKRKGLVLPAEDGQPHRQGYTRKAIARGAKAVGLRGLTPHRMRATCATILARQGASAHTIQRALRHKLLETSRHYVDLSTQDVAKVQAEAFAEYHIGNNPASRNRRKTRPAKKKS